MSTLIDLAMVGAGFSAPVAASQKVFRGALEALSHPGRIVRVESDADGAPGLHPAAAALLLALLDQDTRLWRAPRIAKSAAGTYLRFHTGCTLVDEPERADFAVADATELPPLERFEAGSEAYPDRSATLVVQVDELREGAGWRLSGPGIAGEARLHAAGLDAGFPAAWRANTARFPRGIDLYFAWGDCLAALPRSTRMAA